MDASEQGRIRQSVRPVAAGLLIAVAVIFIVLGLTGADLDDYRAAALPLGLVALVAGFAALVGWYHERVAAARAAAATAATTEKLEIDARVAREAREENAELSHRVGDLEHELDRERSLRLKLERARSAERDWNRELRSQVVHLHRKHGALGDVSDIKQLVLRMAVVLVDAEKGILLSREDEDGDGHPLDVVAHEGFDNDPADSAVAHAFASEVIEADKTIREDDSRSIEREGRTAADDEIDNLVAIPIYVANEFSGVVVCANRDGGFEECEDDVLLALGDHAGAVLENSRLHGSLRQSYLSTVAMLAEAIEAKDPFLRGHSDEVSRYVGAVGERLGLEPAKREKLVFGSLLHDVGKIGISERILLKPARLTPEERSVIELHPRIGYRLVERVPALRDIAPAILHHHERFDGAGYPSKLAGEQIPLEARIICVADSFSAMTAERPYRARMSLEDACAELERCAGSQFDPEVVRIFTEEVRSRPIAETDDAVAAALAADPELELRHQAGELLGQGPLAVTDNLTLLYTHRYFHEVAGKEADRALLQDDTFAVVLVEPCDLNDVNTRDGYAAGDEAIRRVAAVVQRAAVRAGGTACRHGGPRLGLIVPGADDARAERIKFEIGEELGDDSPLSCGHAVWETGESGDDVIARAKRAMQQVAAAG